MEKKLKCLSLAVLIVTLASALSPLSVLAARPNQGEDLRKKADALFREGIALVEQGDWRGALQPFEEALPIFQEIGERHGEGLVLSHLGTIHQVLKNHQQALHYYNESLKVIRNIGDLEWEGLMLKTIGLLYYSLEEYEHALDYFQQELTIRKNIDDREGEGQALFNIGVLYSYLGQDQQAFQYWQEALAIQQSIGNKAGEGETLYSIGRTYSDLGEYSQALATFQQVERIWKDLGEKEKEADVLNRTGLIYSDLGQYQEALGYYQKSIEISAEIGDEETQSATLANIGSVYQEFGQLQLALEYYQKAFAISHERGDQDVEGAALHGIGSVYADLKQFEPALDHYQQALRIAQELDDRKMEGRTWADIGLIYFELGQYGLALENEAQALHISQEIGDRVAEAAAFNTLGRIAQKRELQQDALDFFGRAKSIWQDLGHRDSESSALHNIGSAYMDLEQYSKALENYEQALAIRRANGNRIGEATTLNNIGSTYVFLENYTQALEKYQQALAIFHDVGALSWEGHTLSNMGYVYEKQGDYDQSINYYKQSIDVYETIRGELRVEEFKDSFLSEQFGAYTVLIERLWEEHRFEEAFNYAERARARAFLDQLAGDLLDFRAGADARLLSREQTLKSEITTLHSQLVTLQNRPRNEWDLAEVTTLESRLADAEAAYARLLTEIKLQSPAVASLVNVDVASLAEIQKLIKSNTTLVEYFVTQNRTLAFIITASTFETVAIDVKQEDLEQNISTFLDFASLDNPHPASLERLYTRLIAPLKDKLQTPIIGIVPHGILHYVPFAALNDGVRFLDEDYSLFTLPSASAFRFIKQEDKPTLNTILVLGNPSAVEPGLSELKYATQEAELVAKIFNAQALLREFATESGLRDQASTADIVHIAAHGQYNPVNPSLSVIHLAADEEEDGRLQVHEIYGLDLSQSTDLVVLSACETQGGKASAGDEIVGMSRAFLYAGTPSVIASLWNVDDHVTTLLMERFYMNLRAGMGKAQALQQAQIEIRAQYPHPYYWAAFVLTGDPGSYVPPVSPTQPSPLDRFPGTYISMLVGLGLAVLLVGAMVRNIWRKRVLR